MKEIIDASGGGGGGGGGGGVFVVNVIIGETTATLDKTYAEIKSAFMTGLVIVHMSVPEGNAMRLIVRVYDDEEECAVYTFDPETTYIAELSCSSADDYPYTSLG